MPSRRRPKISIVGAGTVGSALASALHEKGYPIRSIINRTGRKAIALARSVDCTSAGTNIRDLAPDSEVIIIALTEHALIETSRSLAAVKTLKFKKLLVVHTSGVFPSSVLSPVARKGAQVAALHPIQTFPAGSTLAQLRSRVRGIYFGTDGDAAALRALDEIVMALQGRTILVQPELRPLYHSLCVFASGYMAVLLGAINDLSRSLDLHAPWTAVFGPLMTAATENTIKSSAGAAMTGPIVRGDMETIDAHLAALSERAPHLLPLYTIMGIESARIVRSAGRITPSAYEELVTRFREYIKTQPTNKPSKVNL